MTKKNILVPQNDQLRTLVDVFMQLRHSDKNVVCCSDLDSETSLSYQSLVSQSLSLLEKLKEDGLKKGQYLIFQVDDLTKFLVTFGACILGGIIPVPVSKSARKEFYVKLCMIWNILPDPMLCFDSDSFFDELNTFSKSIEDEALLEACRAIQGKSFDLASDRYANNDSIVSEDVVKDLVVDVDPDEIAFIQFSSGSTGQPKGVVLTHKNLVSNIEGLTTNSKSTSDDVKVSWMPLTHDMGLIAVALCALYLNAKMVLIDPKVFVRRPGIWMDKVSKHKGTMLYSPNYGLHMIMLTLKSSTPNWDLSSVRLLFNGAEPISFKLANQFLDVLAPFGFKRTAMFNVYGLAEASVGVALSEVGGPMRPHHLNRKFLNFGEKVVSVEENDKDALTFVEVGTAIKHCYLKIADEQGKDTPDWHIGLIHIKGLNVTSGYLNNEQETRRVLRDDGWLNTGDLGFMIDGRLVITGRAKDMIIINGQNIYAHDVEQKCTELPNLSLRNVVASSYQNQDDPHENLIIFLRHKGSVEKFVDTVTNLKRHIQQTMGLTISQVIPVSVIPKTTSGKVRRFEMKQTFLNGGYDEALAKVAEVGEQSKASQGDNEHIETEQKLKEITAFLSQLIHAEIGYSLSETDRFAENGLDSFKAVSLHAKLVESLKIDIPVSSLFDYPTVLQLASFLVSHLSKTQTIPSEIQAPSEASQHSTSASDENQDIAVIGLAAHFSGLHGSNEDFYESLYEGIELNHSVPAERWMSADFDASVMNTQSGYFMDGVDLFDEAFFGITPVEAKAMDPQHRLLLNTSQLAIDNAGLKSDALNTSKTAVYVGMSNSDFAHQSFGHQHAKYIETHSLTGGMSSTASGRLAYFYGFNGPCMTVDTACSSSLVAIDLARNCLLNQQADMALVAGVNLVLTPNGHLNLSKMNALSSDGLCKVFDDSANGYARGEGCAVLVLKRLSDAQAQGDQIRGIVAGSAVNHDGKSSGLTVPNGLAQEDVVRAALESANVDVNSIDYIEAHGTGTKLGDPQEINALANVFSNRSNAKPLAVGSVKSNIGHLEGAAGIAGVVKVLLGMERGIIPKNMHLTHPNTLIPWAKLPLHPLSEHLSVDADNPIHCGVSSFGLSGTNSHVVLRSYPRHQEVDSHVQRSAVFMLSAKTANSLREGLEKHIDFISHSQHSIADICHASSRVLQDYPQRIAVVGDSRESLLAQLRQAMKTEPWTKIPGVEDQGNIAFLFTGQGSNYLNMGKQLAETFADFNEAMLECDELFAPHLPKRMLSVLYGENTEDVQSTLYAQPIIFSIGVALVRLFERFGITPQYLLGHSIGQYAAAHVAGILNLRDAVYLVAKRARIMSDVCDACEVDAGMIAVSGNTQEIRTLIESEHADISIAASNSSKDMTLSGSKAELNKLMNTLDLRGIAYVELKVSGAFHSTLMQPALAAFEQALDTVTFHTPKLPIISDLTGELATPGQVSELNAKTYWLQHIVSEVRFSAGLTTLAAHGCHAFVEIGGMATLSSFVAKTLRGQANLLNVPTLRNERKPSLDSFYEALCTLYVNHYAVNWSAMPAYQPATIVDLPYYRFEKTSYPLHPAGSEALRESAQALPVTRQASLVPSESAETLTQTAELMPQIDAMLHAISGITMDEQRRKEGFLALGMDSLMLGRLKTSILEEFEIDVDLKDLYSTYQSAELLERHLAEKLAKRLQKTPTAEKSAMPETMNAQPEGVAALMSQQLQSMQRLCEAQLSHLSGTTQLDSASSHIVESQARDSQQNAALTRTIPDTDFRLTKFTPDSLTAQQQAFVEQFIAAYRAKTPKSAAFSAEHKGEFAHYLTTLNYRQTLKDLLYPLVAEQAQGAHMWDEDGNKYVDLAMGYGVHFFGHRPSFVLDAVEKQMQKGFVLSPHSNLLAEVTQLFKEITGTERVFYCNTGSEAVMFALRMARAKTGRNKIVKFSGSYHGVYDSILAETDEEGTYPTTPGITLGTVMDTVVLSYGDPAAIDYIRQHAHELAAVLVEPVQSRKPELQPAAFLRELREITETSGTALIFDEVITGFRLQPGGAQAFYGIKADLVAYGKIVGGGLPIGVVAGKRPFMDVIDGGEWQYQDGSMPTAKTAFIAGTFANHPMSMAAAKSVLLEIKQKGQALYDKTNALAESLVGRLNDYFKQAKVPVVVNHCGPVFRFESFGRYSLALQPIEMDLLFFLMMSKGVYTWERRICFLSTQHTQADVDHVVNVVIESIEALRAGGFAFSTDGNPPPAGRLPETPIKQSEKKNSPMSSAQQRLFVLNSIAGAWQAYHLPFVARVTGPFDRKKAQHALNTIVARHESLRTKFVLEDGQFLRKISAEHPITVEELQATETSVESVVQQCFKPFDLATDAMLRAAVITLEPQTCVFVLDIHHIAVDGYSANILMQEFVALYQQGDAVVLASPVQFDAFIKWEQNYLASADCSSDKQFWQHYLSEVSDLAELPLDHPRPKRQTFDGHTFNFALNQAETAQLQRLAQQCNATPYMVLLSAYQVLLADICQNTHVAIGASVALRQGKDLERIVGMATNTIVYKNRLQPAQTFAQLVAEVKQQCAPIYQHQSLGFEQIVELSKVKRERNRNPLFDANFVYEQADDRIITLDDVRFETLPSQHSGNVYDFSFEAIAQQNTLQINFHYNQHLFNASTIEHWASLTKQLLQRVCNDSQQSLRSLFSSANAVAGEQHALSLAWANEDTLLQRFTRIAKAFPNNVAVRASDTQLTYAQLNVLANQLADKVKQSQQVLVGDRIAVQISEPQHLLPALLCVFKLGCTYVPIDPEMPLERVQFIQEDSGAALMISDADVQDVLNQPESYSSAEPSDFLAAEQAAYVIYTSGTSGKPKGVQVAHRSLVNYFTWFCESNAVSSEDSSVMLSSYAFDLGYTALWGCVLSGACIHMVDKAQRNDIGGLLRYLATESVSFIKMTPSLFQVLVNHQDFAQPASSKQRLALRLVVLGGEMLRDDDVAVFFEQYPDTQFINHYGPTEATIGCIAQPFSALDFPEYRQHKSIGQGISNVQVVILDEQQQPVADGIEGEIAVQGRCLALGYINRDNLQAEKFIPSPLNAGQLMYRTGDKGCIVGGKVRISGRIDEQIKIRGYRVEPSEIKLVLEQHPSIERAVVVGEPSNSGLELVAYYSLEDGSLNNLTRELRAQLLASLPEYMCPSQFVAVQRFPTNANGKLDLAELKLARHSSVVNKALSSSSTATASISKTDDAVPSCIEIEQKILTIWQQQLSVSATDSHQDFFELGGNSLKAMLIAADLSKAFALAISVNELFDHPTIYALGQFLQTELASSQSENGADKTSTALEISMVPQQERYALSSAQKRLWLVSQDAQQSVAYNVHAAFLLDGVLESAALNKALNALVARHESLRTNFVFAQGEPWQIIHEQRILAVNEVTLSGDADSAELHDFYLQEANTHFDLERDVLLRISLVHLPDMAAQVFMFNAHHIICDGWSNNLIMKELIAFYEFFSRHQNHRGLTEAADSIGLQPLAIHYKDYAAWHNRMLSSEQAAKDKAFWREQFSDLKEPSLLPSASAVGRDSSFAGTFAGTWYRNKMTLKLSQQVRDFCRERSHSLYSYFASVAGVLLSHYLREDHVVFATPVADRQHPQLQNQVGFYLNTFLLHQHINETDAFSTLLTATQQTMKGVMQHNIYPVEQVLDDLAQSGEIAGNVSDFYRILLNVMEYESYDSFQIGGQSWQKVLETASTSRADLNIMLINGEQLELMIEYNTQVFSDAEIKTFEQQLIQLMEQALQAPDSNLGELLHSLISQEEQQLANDFLASSLAIDDDF